MELVHKDPNLTFFDTFRNSLFIITTITDLQLQKFTTKPSRLLCFGKNKESWQETSVYRLRCDVFWNV